MEIIIDMVNRDRRHALFKCAALNPAVEGQWEASPEDVRSVRFMAKDRAGACTFVAHAAPAKPARAQRAEWMGAKFCADWNRSGAARAGGFHAGGSVSHGERLRRGRRCARIVGRVFNYARKRSGVIETASKTPAVREGGRHVLGSAGVPPVGQAAVPVGILKPEAGETPTCPTAGTAVPRCPGAGASLQFGTVTRPRKRQAPDSACWMANRNGRSALTSMGLGGSG